MSFLSFDIMIMIIQSYFIDVSLLKVLHNKKREGLFNIKDKEVIKHSIELVDIIAILPKTQVEDYRNVCAILLQIIFTSEQDRAVLWW